MIRFGSVNDTEASVFGFYLLRSTTAIWDYYWWNGYPKPGFHIATIWDQRYFRTYSMFLIIFIIDL